MGYYSNRVLRKRIHLTALFLLMYEFPDVPSDNHTRVQAG